MNLRAPLRPLALSLLLASAAAQAAETVRVRGFPPDMPFISHTRCYLPFVCVKKDETVASYEHGVWGRPKFLPGEVTLADGGRLAGRIAMFQKDHDWAFVQNAALIIPEGETEAYYIGPGDAVLISQQDEGKTRVYDAYAGAYLQRLISGPLRLSYNPAAGTSNKLSSFISPVVLDDAQRRMAGETLLKEMKAGKSVREAAAVADLKRQALDAVLSIEITDKEYLLYSESAKTTTAITEDNYPSVMSTQFAACPSADADKAKKLSKKFGKIEEAVSYLNQTCFAASAAAP